MSWRGIVSVGWGILVLAWLPLSPATAQGGEGRGEGIELSSLNRTYTGLDSDLAPIEEGPLTIRLSSPEHRLVVHGNRLTLKRDYRGRVEAEIEVELEGEGRLIADIVGAGVKNRFTDEVTAERQTLRARGEVRLEAAEGGYRFTVVEPGPAAALKIESRLAGQVVGVCRALALLPLIDLGCDRVEAALSVVRIPLPGPDTELLLPAEGLTAEERAFFDRVAGSPSPPSPLPPAPTPSGRGAPVG